MGTVRNLTNRNNAPIPIATGDYRNAVEKVTSPEFAKHGKLAQHGDEDLCHASTLRGAGNTFDYPVRATVKTRPTMRRALVRSSVIVLCLAMADLAAARETDMRFDMLAAPGMNGNWTRPVPCYPTEKHIGQLARSLRIPQIADELHPSSRSRRVASASEDWKSLLSKTRIDQLQRSISRTLKDLTGSQQPTTGGKHKSGSVVQRLNDPVATTAAWQASQIGVERIAIPRSRPSTVSTSQNLRPVPILAISEQTEALLFNRPLTRETVIACLALILGVLSYRQWVNIRLSRRRTRSEKAIYDAIADLALEGRNLQADVSTVLKRVEEAYGLCATSVVLLQPVTLEVQCAYSSEQQAPLPIELIEEAISEIRNLGEEPSDLTLWRHPSSAGLSEADRPTTSGSPPDAVTSVVWIGDRMGAMLIAQCRPGRRVRSTDAQALQFATQLLALVIDGHFRPTTLPTSSSLARAAGVNGEELAGSIAHEFNNLLMPIMGYAEMAADALNPGSSSRTYVERIQSAGERAKRMIEQILTSSKQENPYSSFDAAAATAEILPDLKMCIPASTDLRASLPDDPVLVHGSATALQQAVVNLCKNAGEALAGGGTITVGVTVVEQSVPRVTSHGRLACGRYVRVSVADTGPGIPAIDLRQIFDPFFTTKSQEGGTGLGLAMVLRVVKRLNGGINVRSAPGLGTRFDLFFPCLSEVRSPLPTWSTVTEGHLICSL